MSRRLSIRASTLIVLILLSTGSATSQTATDPAHAAQALPYPTRTIIDRYASEKPAVSSSWIERDSLKVPDAPLQDSAKSPPLPTPLEPPTSPNPMPTADSPDPMPTAGDVSAIIVDDGLREVATGLEDPGPVNAGDTSVGSKKSAQLPSKKRLANASDTGVGRKKSAQLPSKKRFASSHRAGPRSYAETVRSRLAHHKPANSNLGGAMVSFAIGADGGLSSARVVRSSGNTRADKAALATVKRAAPFPKPPSGKPSVYAIQIGVR